MAPVGSVSAPASGTPAPAFSVPNETLPPENQRPIDAHGVRFDPDIHRTRPDGTPAKNKHGNFYRKETGRPPGPRPPPAPGGPIPAATFNAPAGGGPAATLPAAGPDRYDALAETFLRIGYGPLVILFTDDIRTTDQEHQILKSALANWLRVSQVEDLPPGLAFGLVATGIYLPKFTQPTVRQRLALYWLKIRGFFSGLFSRGKSATPRPAERAKESAAVEIEEDPFREGGQ